MAERIARINKGEQVVVGVNRWTEALPSPLVGGDDGGVFRVEASAVGEALEALAETKRRRDAGRVREALARLETDAKSGANLMEASIECALARVTTGEWAGALRRIFGEYRALTGIDGQSLDLDSGRLVAIRGRIEAFAAKRGHRPRLVVGKPGLDGHSNGAEVIAVAARHAGFDVVYSGIRLTPEEIVASAVEEDADLIGVSILSGSHLELSEQVIAGLRAHGADIPVIVGGIVPKADIPKLIERGVRRVFTPADYQLVDVIERMMDVIED
jgi:(2R)-ethylmalonyl-CoA mutase